ncbi:hypothetical protein AX15_005733 [Amanita polypyramis BW_CC]|nr:hypothetical protein AX15_005733 [Amanita polypyramis BW_CC]
MNDSISGGAEQQCKSLQQEEYEVLEVLNYLTSFENYLRYESIYPDCITGDKSGGLVKLDIPVELEGVYAVDIQEDRTLAHRDDEAKSQQANLSTLPPVLINIALPLLYPLFKSPKILSVRATHFWLPKVSQLQELLNNMWQPGESILYSWVEFIRSGDFLVALGLTSGHNAIQLLHPAPLFLVSSLKSYEDLTKSARFNNNSYLCSICFTSYKGSKCLQLSCSHTFCRTCLADYWKLSIAEGEVGKVGCADPECVKKGREAKMDEVARVVTDEEVRRWKWLREKRMFEKDPTVVDCPMAFCQAPVRPTAGGGADEDSTWGRFRQCDSCGYTFCGLCRRLWHGPHTACAIEHSEKLAMEYLAAEEGTERRLEIERQYGKAVVRRVVRDYTDTMANMEYIKRNTTACPECSTAVEKSLGCNHVSVQVSRELVR